MSDVTEASKPDSVVASPYDGMRYGNAVMMKMPKPKPVVRWMNAAPAAKSIRITISMIRPYTLIGVQK